MPTSKSLYTAAFVSLLNTSSSEGNNRVLLHDQRERNIADGLLYQSGPGKFLDGDIFFVRLSFIVLYMSFDTIGRLVQ